MQIAPPTENEAARLKALYEYCVLDTEAEKVFDDLTLIASQICDPPIALMSLVDPTRQWFKSAVGLGAKETSRDIAFCAHAIQQEGIFEVEDTLKDQRFFDNPLVTEDPSIRFYAGTPLITPDGFAIGTLCAIDTHPRKLTQTQINALEILGRSIISQLELRKKVKLLEQMDKHKTAFLSNMSHELRTPLNAIIGFSGLLLRDIENTVVPDKFKEHLQHIDYSGKRLLSVINSILDFNKIEAGMMSIDPEPVNMRALINHLNGMLAISAAEKDIELQTHISQELPEVLLVDEAKFAQIVINLVSNAIKYSASGKQVSLKIGTSNEKLHITVVDHGVGISTQDQVKLFGTFQQLGKAKSDQGTGLGLAITKGLVDLMQGSISVKSELNIGSTFTVELPLLLTPYAVTSLGGKCDTDAKFDPQKRILVVEDNQINQLVIEAMLEPHSLTATFADSGESALEILKGNKFDLVFMDIHLPGIDGIDTSKQIRQSLPELPIVALTADTFLQERMNKSAPMFDGFLAKPLEVDRLITVLERFLR